MLALAAFALCLARGEANRGFALGLRAVRTGSPPDDDAVETALRAHDAGARGGGDAAAAARGLPTPRKSRADVSSTAANARNSPVQTSKTSRGMDHGEHHQLSFGACGGQVE